MHDSFKLAIQANPSSKIDFMVTLASKKDILTVNKGFSKWFIVFRDCPFSGLVDLISTGRINGVMAYTPNDLDIIGGYFSTDKHTGFVINKQNSTNQKYGPLNEYEAELALVDDLREYWPSSFADDSPYKEHQLFRRMPDLSKKSDLGWLDLDLPKGVARTSVGRGEVPFNRTTGLPTTPEDEEALYVKYPSTDNPKEFLYIARRMGINGDLCVYKSSSTMMGKSKNSAHIIFPFKGKASLSKVIQGIDERSLWLDFEAPPPNKSSEAYKMLKDGVSLCLPQEVIGLNSVGIADSKVTRCLPDRGIYRTTQQAVCNFTGEDPVMYSILKGKPQNSLNWTSRKTRLVKHDGLMKDWDTIPVTLFTESDSQLLRDASGYSETELKARAQHHRNLAMIGEFPASTKVYDGKDYLGTLGELDQLPTKTNCNSLSRPDKTDKGAAYIPGRCSGVVVEFSEGRAYTIVYDRKAEKSLFTERVATSEILTKAETDPQNTVVTSGSNIFYNETDITPNVEGFCGVKHTNSTDVDEYYNSKGAINRDRVEGERERIIEYDTKYAPFPIAVEYPDTVIVAPTGSGKSFGSINLAKSMRGYKVFIVEPFHSAADNIYEEFLKSGADVMRFESNKHKLKDLKEAPRIIVLTMDMFAGLFNREEAVDSIFSGVGYSIIVDEVHELFGSKNAPAKRFIYDRVLSRRDNPHLLDVLALSATLDLGLLPLEIDYDLMHFKPTYERQVEVTDIMPWDKLKASWEAGTREGQSLAFISVPSRVMATELFGILSNFKGLKILKVIGQTNDSTRTRGVGSHRFTTNTVDSTSDDVIDSVDMETTYNEGYSGVKHTNSSDVKSISDFTYIEDVTISEMKSYDVIIATGTLSVGTSLVNDFIYSIVMFRGRGVRGGIASWIQRLSRTRSVEKSYVVVPSPPKVPKNRQPKVTYSMVKTYGTGMLQSVNDFRTLYQLAKEHMLMYSVEEADHTKDDIFVASMQGKTLDSLSFTEYGAKVYISNRDQQRLGQIWVKSLTGELMSSTQLIDRRLAYWGNWIACYDLHPDLGPDSIANIEADMLGDSVGESSKELKKYYRRLVDSFETRSEVTSYIESEDENPEHRDSKDGIIKYLPFRETVVVGRDAQNICIQRPLTEYYQVKMATDSQVRRNLMTQEYLITLNVILYAKLLKIRADHMYATRNLAALFKSLFGNSVRELQLGNHEISPEAINNWPAGYANLNQDQKNLVIKQFIRYMRILGRVSYYDADKRERPTNSSQTRFITFNIHHYENYYVEYRQPTL